VASIAVIGGGPKAAAIVAKADVLSRHSPHAVPQVTIYERTAFGAAWTGGIGYTDGLQPLCTLAERDLGFPYAKAYGADVAEALFARYSWQAFGVQAGNGRARYEQWVLHGRRPPTHLEFARYLDWAIRTSGARYVHGDVIGLAHDAKSHQWDVTWEDATGRHITSHDAVVVTGSGPPVPPFPGAFDALNVRNPRVFDGVTFWTELDEIASILAAESLDTRKVVLIGAGGTAAAIAHWFVRARIDVPVVIIGREPTLYARHPGYFEDRLFSDDAAWSALPAHVRDEFVRRLTTGVVWNYVLENLDGANLTYTCADAVGFQTPSSGSLTSLYPGLYPEVQLDIRPTVPEGSPPSTVIRPEDGAVFVDARGFDRWWFASLLEPALAGHLARSNQAAVMASIDDALRLSAPFPLGLHVPMVASRQGPAAGDLMALGWMSDRILRAFVPPTTPLAGGGSAGTP
jgi:mycobactin lysine-N-oxygenase